MNTKKPKFLHDVENFRTWYSELKPKDRKIFKEMIFSKIWPEKPRSTFYNFYYGRTPVSYLLATKIAELVLIYDDSITAQQLFPNLNLISEMENKILQILTEKNMSQQKLANITEIDRQRINGYISHNIRPNVYDAIKIAKALGVTVEDLFHNSEKCA